MMLLPSNSAIESIDVLNSTGNALVVVTIMLIVFVYERYCLSSSCWYVTTT